MTSASWDFTAGRERRPARRGIVVVDYNESGSLQSTPSYFDDDSAIDDSAGEDSSKGDSSEGDDVDGEDNGGADSMKTVTRKRRIVDGHLMSCLMAKKDKSQQVVIEGSRRESGERIAQGGIIVYGLFHVTWWNLYAVFSKPCRL